MQSAIGEQFLNITFLLVLFTAALAAVMFETVTVPLTSVCVHNYNHINLTLSWKF